jgi:hypothetical protein
LKNRPNQRNAGNGRIALRFQIEHDGLAVPEHHRSTKDLMKAWAICAALLLSWATAAHSASDKSVLDIAPTLAELGSDWTTNQIVYLIDPRCQPPEQVYPGHPEPIKHLDHHRQMMKSSGRTGYLRMHYGCGDLTVNRGGYHVYLQRWENPEMLNSQRFQEWKRLDRPAPDVGQEAYWKSGDMYDGLVFRRDQYLVIVEFGPASDYSRATRLAQVIDAKITGQLIPKAPEPERLKSVEPDGTANWSQPVRPHTNPTSGAAGSGR